MGHTLNRLESWQKNNQPSQLQNITTQRSHFRGALLGFTLAPTAVALALTDSAPKDISSQDISSQNISSQDSGHSDSGAHATADGSPNVGAAMAQRLSQKVEYCLEQVRHFLATAPVPSAVLSLGDASSQASHHKTWLDAVPTLLRYYDHPASHSLWQADAATTAQYWMLSDILARAMSGQPLTKAWLRQQTQQAIQTKGASLVDCHYQWLWYALRERLLPDPKTDCRQTATPLAADSLAADSLAADSLAADSLGKGSLTENSLTSHSPTPNEMAHHRTVVTGIACALDFICEEVAAISSASYSLSVSMAAQKIAASNNDGEIPLIAGLVSGAIVGYSGLPILWQQAATDIALADTLFYQWAGFMPERSPFSAKN